ncbi:class I SAM-dependent methyltransferase [Streptomyces sp. NPDC052301]|uniref:class I SAM-dependent methyltransferase n=1 Tax=Streptomyces sp. NPDC052301 TaxID=3365687 RepID=UPI0037CF1A21
MPLYVDRAARPPGVTARHGDARALDVPDMSVDVVLLSGPLYHLLERPDRGAPPSPRHAERCPRRSPLDQLPTRVTNLQAEYT